MVTVSLSKTAAEGSSYFSEDEGYYAAPAGASRWHGRGAETLGLSGEVNKRALDMVLNGYDPRNGEKLVKNAGSENITGEDGKVIKRGRVAYIDVHAAPPKSVSVLSYADKRIEPAHNKAVEKIIAKLETDYAFTRRDKSGQIRIARSDNLTIARINHYESRDHDPQLHSHLVVMNLTCGDDGKWRSIEAGKIYRDQQYLGQIYRNELAKELKTLGYDVAVTDPVKGLFEVRGVPGEVVTKFSRRRQSILKKLEEYEEKGKHAGCTSRQKAQFACLDTRRKKEGVYPEELREKMEAELAGTGRTLAAIREEALRQGMAAPPNPPRSAQDCVRAAINDVMDKQSATTEKAVLDRALKGCMGYYTLEQLAEVLRAQADWEPLGGGAGDKYPTAYYTTAATREAERNIVDYALRDRGQYGEAIPLDKWDGHAARIVGGGKRLSRGQYDAARMICTARDRVSLVQGDAGAGKTFAMETVREALEAEGIAVRGFAPTGKAAEELNAAGVKSMTIHKYLESPKAQEETGEGGVWLIDEAGMIGSKRLHGFLQKADEKGARVILIGDTKQFQSVEQGKMFQALQDRRASRRADGAFIEYSEITEVKRQKTEHTKTVVKAVKDEDFETAFRVLERHDGFREVPDDDDRIKRIVSEYVSDRARNVESVVLTASNADKDKINRSIREILAREGTRRSRKTI